VATFDFETIALALCSFWRLCEAKWN